MKLEYLLLNVLILIGPLLLSFEKQVRFVTKWRHAFPAILITAVPYLIWDAMVTGRHWWFNERHTLSFRFAGLPLEECLFFVTVPFASLFIWEVIGFHFADKNLAVMRYVRRGLYPLPLLGLLVFIVGKEYTGLMLVFTGAAAILDRILKTDLLWHRRLLTELAIVFILILIFNSYLTWRPVVLYDEAYQLGKCVGTIPIEDFGYGLSLILFVLIIYEKLKMVDHA
ncbi:MAG: lycopene cyclase domain-containing protein [candidate division KSB1 bacterium]|nr:lycopene cyclase domain-containing protein [candidate division KSB1 bacterium]MDZ7304010.1 lycopene cyclase domain-containing protein [candidate division KSB1 bacterium]MDZ7313280.1 lycopene cyclase domain-containing protein [candidate division KSB1 bacterium]